MQKASFTRKAVDIDELKGRTDEERDKNCFVIEKVIELTTLQYDDFSRNLLDDYDFIEHNKDLMYIDNDRILHTVLIKELGMQGGILIESEGYNYARYSGYYEEDGFVTDKLMQQILIIRKDGLYNMFDIIGVQREAFEKGFNELVVFLEEHKKEYAQFILIGQR